MEKIYGVTPLYRPRAREKGRHMSWQSSARTKKAFKEEASAPNTKINDICFAPGPFPEKTVGRVAVEGPYPVHKWYATVELDDNGYITKVS